MWYIYNDGISVIKRNETGSLSDMEGPGVCHTEWGKSEREKQIFILMHVCGIQKDGKDELVCRARIETQL